MNSTCVHDAPAPSPDVVVVVLLMAAALALLVADVEFLGLVFVGCLYWPLLPGYDATSNCWH